MKDTLDYDPKVNAHVVNLRRLIEPDAALVWINIKLGTRPLNLTESAFNVAKNQIDQGYCVFCVLGRHRLYGLAHKNDVGTGATFYLAIKNSGYTAKLRTLCFNCNLGRYNNGGLCPHQTSKEYSKAT